MFDRIFLDTNVVLDFVLNRESFIDEAEKIFLLQENEHATLHVSALTLANVAYIVKGNGKNPFEITESLLQWVKVVDLKLSHFEKTVQSQFHDFEDGLQFFAAIEISGIDAIITRDKGDFNLSTIPVYTPKEFLNQFTH
jgi:predicted nucleic acid-binding protein